MVKIETDYERRTWANKKSGKQLEPFDSFCPYYPCHIFPGNGKNRSFSLVTFCFNLLRYGTERLLLILQQT